MHPTTGFRWRMAAIAAAAALVPLAGPRTAAAGEEWLHRAEQRANGPDLAQRHRCSARPATAHRWRP